MPSTIREAIAEATGKLTTAGVDAPKLVAQVLLAHALGVPRASVLISPPHHVLQPHQIASFRALVARCVEGEPMAYVVGHTEFYALEFQIDRRALIPRPETEQLVELALRRLSVSECATVSKLVVDVGTGSGCIVVSLAVKLPKCASWRRTFRPMRWRWRTRTQSEHKVSSRIQFLRGDLLAPVPVRAEGVVANLPYVTTAEWQTTPAPHSRPRAAHRARWRPRRAGLASAGCFRRPPDTSSPMAGCCSKSARRKARPSLHSRGRRSRWPPSTSTETMPGLTRIVEIQLRAVPGVKMK